MSKPVIAIHGGAGAITRAALSAEKNGSIFRRCPRSWPPGRRYWHRGSALDAVTEAVRLLEECPLFNAGKGSVFTHQGTHELDACVMDGRTCDAGAVAGVSRIRNPVLAARAVLENSEHVLFAAEGAEKFAAAHGTKWSLPISSLPGTFRSAAPGPAEQGRVLLDHDGAAQAGEPLDPDRKFGTVGAVALDALGNLAAATSTGGMTNKQAGRVGDTPIIGAGCYANNATVAVSSTGTGEIFMRGVAAYDVSALIEYGDLSLQAASDRVVMDKLPALGGSGGMIAVDRYGNIALPFNCEGCIAVLAMSAMRRPSGFTVKRSPGGCMTDVSLRPAGSDGPSLPPQRVLTVRDLSISFPQADGAVAAVRNLSFDLDRGETLAIVGESGSGKSVTSLGLMRLVEQGGGRIVGGAMTLRRRDGALLDLAQAPQSTLRTVRGADMAMIFREPMTSLNPVFPVGEQIAESLRLHQRMDRRSARREALRMLDLVRIPEAKEVLGRYPHQLSGGMRQRVMIAMALSCKPALLIADEPTTALDVTIQAQILQLIRVLQREMQMGVIFITHDMGVVAEIADRVLVMRRGEQVEQNRVRELFTAPQQAYTGRCWRRCRSWGDGRSAAAGEVSAAGRRGGYGAAGYRAAVRRADPAGGASGHAL